MSDKDQKFHEFKALFSQYVNQSSNTEDEGAVGVDDPGITNPLEGETQGSDDNYLVTKSGRRYLRPNLPPPDPPCDPTSSPLHTPSMSRAPTPPPPPMGNRLVQLLH